MHLINYAPTLLPLTNPFLIYGFDIFKSDFKTLTHKSPNMDTLVSIDTLSSLTYSLVPKNLPASENLIRLLTKREDLISINKTVDIYNILSIESKLCLGAHDIDKVDGNVTLKTSYT